MKSVLTLFSLVVSLSLYGQITLTHDDMPAIEDQWYWAEDTLLNVSVGNAGANQTWDLTGLDAHERRRFEVKETSKGIQSEAYSEADFVIVDTGYVQQIGQPGFYTYATVDQNSFRHLGWVFDRTEEDYFQNYRLEPSAEVIRLPANYESSYIDNFGYDTQLDGFNSGFDSVRFVKNYVVNSEIDGWGTLRLASGDYDALRRRVVTTTVDSLFAKSFGAWTFFVETVATVEHYEYLTKEAKGVAVVLETDIEGNVTSANFWQPISTNVIDQQIVNSIRTFPNPSQDYFILDINKRENRHAQDQLILWDKLGRILGKYPITDGENKIRHELSTGLYFYTIVNQKAILASGKIKVVSN